MKVLENNIQHIILEKELIVDKISTNPRTINTPYEFELVSGNEKKSRIILDRVSLKEFGIDYMDCLKKVLLTLKSENKIEDQIIGNYVGIGKIEEMKRINWHYSLSSTSKREKKLYSATFHTKKFGGRISPVPCPNYNINIQISEDEFRELKELSPDTVMKVSLKYL